MNKIKRLYHFNNKIKLIKRYFKVNYRNVKIDYKILNKTPYRVRIETSNKCNLKCLFCPLNIPSYKRPIKTMDIQTFNNIIDEVAKFKPKPDIVLYMGGEPLLNPNIFNHIDYCKDKGLYVELNTNATLLTNFITQRLLMSGLDLITISFDDLSPKLYEKLRKNTNYKDTLKKIKFFLDINKSYNDKIEVCISGLKLKNNNTVVNQQPAYISKRFKKLFKDYNIPTILMFYAHNWANNKKTSFGECKSVFHDIAVLSNGNIVPCCYDLNGDYIIGNIKDTIIKEAWNGIRFNNLRIMLNNKQHDKIKLCSGCMIDNKNIKF